MKSTKIAALLSAGLLLAGLTACSGNTADAAGDKPAAKAESNWPQKGKTIDLIVAYAPGGSVDTAARVVAPALEKELGVNVQVTNKPGAGGQIGYTALANSKPDGYTIGAVSAPSVVVTPLDPSRGATFTRESFLPLARQVFDPQVIAVKKDSKFKDLKSLIEYAKAHPGELSATTTGIQTGEHFAMTSVEEATGAKFNLVAFSEGAASAMAAFLGDHVDIYVGNVSDIVDSGSNDITVIGVMGEERSPSLPDAHTFTEEGYDVDEGTARGYVAPAGLPEDVAKKLEDALGKVIQDPAVVDQMTKLGLPTAYLNSADYIDYWSQQETLYKKLLPKMTADKK
jgi:tripartite-type tricarboxylate transporter receptor subunit TctC